MRFHFINVCWGEEYSRMCVEDMLPTLLSPGNFADPALAGRAVFKLYTTPSDFERIRESPAYERLEQLMEIEVIDLDKLRQKYVKHEVMNLCHTHAILQSKAEGAALVFLCPDLVVSDGLCHRLVELTDQGKSVVLISGDRLSHDGFHQAFAKIRESAASPYPGIPPREMVRIALDSMCRYIKSMCWDSSDIILNPHQFIWRVGLSGYLARCFGFHPLLVLPEEYVMPRGTIDGDFVARACPTRDRYYVVEDSDEFSAYTLNRYDEFSNLHVSGRYTEEAVGAFILAKIKKADFGDQNLLYARRIIRFHVDDLDEKWDLAAAESNKVLAGIFRYIKANRSNEYSLAQWEWHFRELLQAAAPLSAKSQEVVQK